MKLVTVSTKVLALTALTLFFEPHAALADGAGSTVAEASFNKAPENAVTDHAASWQALMRLVEGNRRYLEDRPSHQLQDSKRRKALLSAQKPQTLILSCSDSRVPPEIIFDQGLGEIFVVRTAGEVPDRTGMASIDYAVEHLGVKVIVALGHESCGAVKAALAAVDGKSAGSENLDGLVAAIKANLGDAQSAADIKMTDAVRSNVSGIAARLSSGSKTVAEALGRNEIMIVRALYHLDSGKVDFVL